jgi:hypothetical protein
MVRIRFPPAASQQNFGSSQDNAQQSRRDLVGEIGELSLEQNTIIRLAATWAIDQAREVVNTLYHSAGATAILSPQCV